jgi:hypothetical protein
MSEFNFDAIDEERLIVVNNYQQLSTISLWLFLFVTRFYNNAAKSFGAGDVLRRRLGEKSVRIGV